MQYAPMAKQVQSQGRGNDTMLIHMTPEEVGGLQSLAMAHGGSLTINPQTGLPEAGWLGKLLPTILGIAGAAFGLPTWAIGLGGAVGGTAATGDLGKGLMAGLQAFGGASLAGGLGIGKAGETLTGEIARKTMETPLLTGGSNATANLGSQALGNAVANVPQAIAPFVNEAPLTANITDNTLGNIVGGAPKPNFINAFANAAKGDLPTALQKYAPAAAGLGLLSAASDATAPNIPKYNPEEGKSNYGGPYVPSPRKMIGAAPTTGSTREQQWFDVVNPVPGFQKAANTQTGYPEAAAPVAPYDFSQYLPRTYYAEGGQVATTPYQAPVQVVPQAPMEFSQQAMANQLPTGTQPAQGLGQGSNPYPPAPSPQQQSNPNNPSAMGGIKGLPALARGGEVPLKDGSFIVDARTVSELGNGSSEAGQEVLAKLGGVPIKGPGDGVSDSIRARMSGGQEARVARDEVRFSPEAVARLGKGDHKRGTQKLYAMMDKAHKARKRAGRGQDTGLRRGLA